MLTAEDIKNLTDYQLMVFKDVFLTKEEFNEKFSRLQTSVDSFAKDKQDKDEAMPVLNRRIKDVEDFLDKAAPKLGLEFRH